MMEMRWKSGFRLMMSIIFSLLLLSCGNHSFKEYRRIQPAVFFKLHTFGEETRELTDGDLITIHISYSTLDDSVFFKGLRKLRLEDTGLRNSIYGCFINLNKGDSASFIFRSSDFFVKNLNTPVPAFLIHHKQIKMNVSVLDIQTNADFQAEKQQFLKWTDDIQKVERDIILGFLEEERITIDQEPSGLYFILTKVGTGQRPVVGDVVKINYEGKFIDGRYFDSTKKGNAALEFVYGQEYMVIKGIEEAIGMMREGDKAVIILPSSLAFGSSGAGDGIIPPYTALIYELELLNVHKINSQ